MTLIERVTKLENLVQFLLHQVGRDEDEEEQMEMEEDQEVDYPKKDRWVIALESKPTKRGTKSKPLRTLYYNTDTPMDWVTDLDNAHVWSSRSQAKEYLQETDWTTPSGYGKPKLMRLEPD